MKILVVGGGGREHAIVMKLAESKKVSKIYCAPGNGGISKYAECFPVKATDIDGMLELAKKLAVDLVFVAPDDPLVAGMVDVMQKAGFRTFGPDKAAAIIEGSKVFSKNLMQKYSIPTAKYAVFDDPAKVLEYIANENTYPAVIKADGLALGKGVVIAQNFSEAENAVKDIMESKIFGESGSQVVVEEFLTGPEVSVLCFTDGKTVRPMVSSMDHKRALDNDEGLNTGGMGTVAPNPYYTEEIAKECMDTIFMPTIRAMQSEGRTFKGCLYFGLMLTPNGPKVIEYNCRFGDPETQVVLPLLDTDFVDIIEAIENETLADLEVNWKNECAACVVMASGGYPKKYESGLVISGLDDKGQIDSCFVYHAGTKINDEGDIVNAGGRVLGVTATAGTLPEALDIAYNGVKSINWKDVHYRKDIGQRALKALNNN
ncbi:MAG: phosphoribosylamine--glycine ligase [Ruminococcus sp.]